MNTSEQKVVSIPIKDISISDFNVRLHGQKEGIEDLASSIEEIGLLQPVVLLGTYGNPPYDVIVGQRRFRAFKLLKKKEIPAIFRPDLGEMDAKILSLVENMHRIDLNIADKSEAITYLYHQLKKDIKKVAKKIGCSESTVRDYVKFEEFITDNAKELLRKKKVFKIDVKRAYTAAQGDQKKMDRYLSEMDKLTKYDKIRMEELGRKNPQATAVEIIREAKTGKIERVVMLNISKEVDEALNKAKRNLSMDKETIATNALIKWLKDNGFLKY